MRFSEQDTRFMRILFLLTQDIESPSGLGRYFPLASELVRLGHQVNILALHPSFQTLKEKRFESRGVVVQYVAPMHVKKQGNEKTFYPLGKLLFLVIRATLSLIRAALSTPSDIVYVCKPHPMNILAALVLRGLGWKRMVLDCDDYEAASNRFNANWQKKIVELFEKGFPRHTEIVTTNTYFMMGKLISWGVPSERLLYLPNGVDRQRFTALDRVHVDALRTELGLTDKKVVAYIGSLSLTTHPVNLLLDAFPHIKQIHAQCVLLLVGGGEDFLNLEQQARGLGIEESVRFCGRVSAEEIPYYYQLADVSVDPVSDDDAGRGRCPLKLFEGWASGVPFVTADVGDRRILLGSPPAGMIVQAGNPTELAEAIIQVISDKELMEALRLRGLQRVESFYWDKLVNKIEYLYKGSMVF